MIAGFDPSLTHFGWVILDETKTGKDAVVETGTFVTAPTDGLLVQRLIMQRERVRQLLTDRSVQFVSMEAPYWGGYSTELLFALNQFVHEVFLNLKVFVIYIQPDTLRKIAIPNMNPKEVNKNHMVHQAKTELDRQGKRLSEHVADAYFAGKVGHMFFRWYFLKQLTDNDLPEYTREVFCGKHTFVKGDKKGTTEYNGIIYNENDLFFDYTKQPRNTKSITQEVGDGRENIDAR